MRRDKGATSVLPIPLGVASKFAMVHVGKVSAISTLDLSAKPVGNSNVSAACSCTYLNIVSVNNVFCTYVFL